jgi:hypothetical protein
VAGVRTILALVVLAAFLFTLEAMLFGQVT